MQIQQVLCDHCGDVVRGKVGTAYVNKDYIQIRGRMVFETWNEETRKYDYTLISPSEHEEMAFCVKKTKKGLNLECLEAYIEHRVATGKVNPIGTKSRTFGAEGEIKESSLCPMERPKDMPPFRPF